MVRTELVDIWKEPVLSSPFPNVLTLIVPPEIVTPALIPGDKIPLAKFSRRPAMFTIPPVTSSAPLLPR